MFDHSFLQPFDRKYRSATVLLVLNTFHFHLSSEESTFQAILSFSSIFTRHISDVFYLFGFLSTLIKSVHEFNIWRSFHQHFNTKAGKPLIFCCRCGNSCASVIGARWWNEWQWKQETLSYPGLPPDTFPSREGRLFCVWVRQPWPHRSRESFHRPITIRHKITQDTGYHRDIFNFPTVKNAFENKQARNAQVGGARQSLQYIRWYHIIGGWGVTDIQKNTWKHTKLGVLSKKK